MAVVLARALSVDAEGVSSSVDDTVVDGVVLRAKVHHGTVLEDDVNVAINIESVVKVDGVVGHIPCFMVCCTDLVHVAGEGSAFLRAELSFSVHVQVGDAAHDVGIQCLAVDGVGAVHLGDGAAIVGVAVLVDEGVGEGDGSVADSLVTIGIDEVGVVRPAERDVAEGQDAVAVFSTGSRHLAAVDGHSAHAGDGCISSGRHYTAVDGHRAVGIDAFFVSRGCHFAAVDGHRAAAMDAGLGWSCGIDRGILEGNRRRSFDAIL